MILRFQAYFIMNLSRFSSVFKESHFAEANLPTAQNIKWSSYNFKSIVEWTGPATDFTYTVEVRSPFSDWEKKCINTKSTDCDVSDLLQRFNVTHDVRITSETEDPTTEEFPYADGPSFNPYDQTIIGKPVIQGFEFNKEHTQLKVTVQDSLTPYRFPNRTLKTIRDIFQDDFKYTVFYRKADSTGRKEASSVTNEIIINASKGESYCFYVRATVPSRKTNRNSQDSDEKCTPSAGTAASGFAAPTVFLYLCNLILLLWLL
ncbi:tissue factor [Gastrophryne carolinensis]